uniref:WGS project CAEQ00000000 data, annotated contig 770 n=1 Tax=Trypanosoma congolense (strain IL3000) TaxID=1068625 RepID=F9WID5_TRYCI|nr:unnamed protein product [Trypanosoma congolense IL3000]
MQGVNLGDENKLCVQSLEAAEKELLSRCKQLSIIETVQKKTMELLQLCTSIREISFDTEYPFVDLQNFPALGYLVKLFLEEAPWLESFEGICNLPELQAFRVTGAPLRDDYLHTLSAGRNLVELRLESCNDLTDLSPLASIKTLKHLFIVDCVSVKKGIGTLGGLPTLRELYLSGTSMDSESLCGLCDTRSLAVLTIVSCGALEDISLLATIRTLHYLTVEVCTALKTGAGDIGKLPELYELDLSYSSIKDSCLSGLSESHSLRKLVLASCSNLSDVSSLGTMMTLEYLSLNSCGTVGDGAGNIGNLPKLRELDLASTNVTDATLKGLCVSRCLSKLNISACSNLTDLSPLVEISTLEELNIRACMELRRGIGDLGKLPALRKLDAACTPITNDLVQELSVSRSLVILLLDFCVDMTDVSHLANMSTLEELSINSCVSVTQGVGTLRNLPRLRNLNMRAVDASEDELTCLREMGVSLLR